MVYWLMTVLVNLCHATTFLQLDTKGKTQKALIFHDRSTSLSNVTELNLIRVFDTREFVARE